MAATDNPLKRLVTTFIEDFAEWVLGTQVAGVTSRNIELYADTIRSDQIFLVKLIDKRTVILHLEFQGRRTDKPMSLRELDYLSRLTQTYRDMELYSVVFYVGHGAGRHDTGSYQVKSPTGDDELLDTPFLRRIRTKSREDGVEEGREEGREKGREKGREEGREEGMLISRRDAILDVLMLRFEPQLSQFRKIERYLSTLTEMEQLERLLTEAVQSKDVSAFQATMAQS